MMTIKAITFASILLAATAIGAFAHSGAKGVVMERMELMKSIQGHMKTVGEMIQGKRAFKAADAKSAAENVAQHAEELPHKFPEGTVDHPSEALPSIWQDWERFVSIADEMKIRALALADAAEISSDASGLRPAFTAVGKTCSACHEDFRKTN